MNVGAESLGGRTVSETLAGFLRAENRRDWEAYRGYLAPGVECITYGPKREVVRGRDAYVEGVVRMYEGRQDRFEVTGLAVDEKDGTAFVELVIGGLRSVNVFQVEDGKINLQREYLEDGYWRRGPTTDAGT